MFLLKLIVCFCVVIVLSVQNSNSIDVKCEVYLGIRCEIKNIENFHPGDRINLVELINPNGIKEFSLLNVTGMTSFPNEILDQLPSLDKVYIRNTSIETITRDFVKRTRNKIWSLEITESKLKSIPSEFLVNLPNVFRLNLSDNHISTIEDAAFASSNLYFLYLNQNKLKVIKKEMFVNASALRQINLSNNLVEEIYDGAFDLPGLGTLKLNGNRLKTLPENLFTNAPLLHDLYLQSNELIDISALKNLQQIWEVNLNDNPTIKNVDVLWQLPSVLWLSLANTSLALDTVMGPLNSIELLGLNISQNNLTESRLLHHLSGLKTLRELKLVDNNLTRLDDFDKIEEYLPNLISISLDKNPWNCDWMKSATKICQEKRINCPGISDDDCVEQTTVTVIET